MKHLILFVLIAGLVLAVGTAQALTLNPTSGYGWVAWDGTQWNGDVYWDPYKPGGHSEPNLGTIVEGSVYYPGYKATLADSGGAADPNVTFYNGQEWAAIIIEVAGLSDYNYFGYYQVGSPNVWYQLFSGAQGATAKAVFHAPHHFGFYLATGTDSDYNGILTPGEASWVWYTESSNNTIGGSSGDNGKQHFAFFQAKPLVSGLGAYIIGIEDLPLDNSDKDYNDFVVYVANIPDASTWMLFLSGMPALTLLRRRKG